jgi:hypothetical protein
MVRILTLTLGPPLIVGLAYLVARPDVGRLDSASPAANAAPSAASSAAENPSAQAAGAPVPGVGDSTDASLVAACQRKREVLTRRLGTRFFSIVHTPFVILGDVSASDLERHYRETIGPTARALAIAYFDRPPSEPVSMILLSGEEAYQSCAELLDSQKRAAFAGYYERSDHRIVINAATGEGTIAHELTHALGHCDFPDMPEWFDEGLASLYEEARFSDDRLRIIGTKNWRIRYLLPALKQGTLRPLELLIGEARVRPDQQAVDYAHARYFCLFLQERGLLEPFYRKFRPAVAGDPTGLRTLHALFNVNDLGPLDEEFRSWVLALERPAARVGAPGPAADTNRDGRPKSSNKKPAAEPY